MRATSKACERATRLAAGRADAGGRGVALLEGRELERHGRLQTAHLELHAVGLRRDGECR